MRTSLIREAGLKEGIIFFCPVQATKLKITKDVIEKNIFFIWMIGLWSWCSKKQRLLVLNTTTVLSISHPRLSFPNL
jgi:hypothetical protein